MEPPAHNDDNDHSLHGDARKGADVSGFAVDGLVSGLDTTSLVKQLMQLEALPRQRLQATATDKTTEIKALQSLATALKKLDDAATALSKAETWTGAAVTTTGDAVVATSRSTATPGSYGVQVHQLASPASWTTTGTHAMTGVVATGALSVTKADGTVVPLDKKSGSLADVVAAINGTEGLGLSAVAVRTGDNAYRLQITSAVTGENQGSLAVSGVGDLGAVVPGTDALYSINGLEGRSSSNSITDLVSGVDVTLARPGPATLAVATDRTGTASAVDKLVTAANEALAEVKKHTLVTTEDRGPLASDGMVRALSGRLLQAVTSIVGGTAGIGIQSTKDGSLVLDTAVLTAALSRDATAVRASFGAAEGTGILGRLREVVKSSTDPADGFLTSSIQGRERSKKDIESQIVSWDRRLESRQSTLQKQFSGLEVALQRLQSQSQYLAGQLGSLSSGS